MITINVVRLSSGLLIGRTFSDSWNLMTLLEIGQEEGLKLNISTCQNKGQLDRLRRTLKKMGFALRVSSKDIPVFVMSPEEEMAMSGTRKLTSRRRQTAS